MTEFEMRNHLMQETAKRTYALRELDKQQTENRILKQQFEHEKEKNRRLYEEIEKTSEGFTGDRSRIYRKDCRTERRKQKAA